jgi:hypothetical protein
VENIEELKREVFSWAAECGQEHVAIEITRMWFRFGGNNNAVKLHQIENADGVADWRAINNNRQLIFRWLRGETKAARQNAGAGRGHGGRSAGRTLRQTGYDHSVSDLRSD